ncbi:hypothetical protein V1264_015501 [Littorina saxatilis]|uniref:Death domain-containing protein n=1 Tax=Littorina saxatilis TaxID=31220 RepID=A0AAN9BLU8_9CAEN
MENGGGRSVSPNTSSQQNGHPEQSGGITNIFITDDEGIGGSVNNSPRPGSAMAESRPPTSTAGPPDDLGNSPAERELASLQSTQSDSPQPSAGSSPSKTSVEYADSPSKLSAECAGPLPPANDFESLGSPSKSSEKPSHSRNTLSADTETNGLSSGSEIDLVADVNNDQPDQPARFTRRCGGEGHSHGVKKTQGHHEQKAPVAPKRPKSSRMRREHPPVNPSSSDAPKELPSVVTSMDGEFAQQLQKAMSALEEYQNRLKTPQSAGGVPGLDEAEDLRRTLDKMGKLCDACISSSASLSEQLSTARQLTENINQDLTHKLESTDLKDWIPPGSCREEEDTLPEKRQAAERERLARAAEARAAVARASYVMQSKTQELARAESAMAEAELAAAAAKVVAEEAVQQMEASQAAEEAKRIQDIAEAEEEEARRREEEEIKKKEEDGEQEKENHDRLSAGEEGSKEIPEEEDSKQQPPEQEQEDLENAEQRPEDQTQAENHLQENDGEQHTEEHNGNSKTNESNTIATTDEKQQSEIEQQNTHHEDDREEEQTELMTQQEKEEEEEVEQEPELTSQRVLQEVHVVHESQDFGDDGGVGGGGGGDDDDVVDSRHLENQDSWPRFIYSLDTGDWDTGLGCVVKSPTKSVGRDDIEVTRVHPASADLRLHDSEELISNIVQIASCGHHQGKKFSPFLSVSLPHCAPRMHPGREPSVRLRPLRGGGWRDLPTDDVIFDDIREHKFVEARVQEPGTLCVVLRLKREEVEITRFGGKAVSSADSRVTLTWPPDVVNATADLTMGVQLLDQATVTDLRARTDVDCGHLMSSSPIMHMQSKGTKLLLPLTITLPCPLNPAARPQRPATSVQQRPVKADSVSAEGGEQRPVSARPLFSFTKKAEEIYDDEVHVLWRKDGGAWTELPDIQFQQSKKKDIVIFELRQPFSRILILRTRAGLSQAAAERIASTLEHMAAHHPAQLVLRQNAKDPSQLILTYTNDAIMERSMRQLADEGYVQGPPLSTEVKLREGQTMEISFRGNIQPMETDFLSRCVFYSNIPFRAQFCVEEIDRFAQKGFDTYRGFVQLSATYTAPFRRSTSSSGMSTNGHGGLACFLSGKHMLSELMINLPKPEPEPPKPLNTAPVLLKSYGPVTNDLLRHVAQQLAADDWKRLAPILNVRRTRLQAILRQNVSSPAWVAIYDVLLTWSKRLPQAFDRVEVLCAALTTVGRHDLAEAVQDQAENFRHDHFLSTRETLLNKAFVRIARHEKAVAQWRRLALFLGLSETEVDDVMNGTCSARERCIQSLQCWKENQDESGDLSTVTLLSRKLRLCRFRALASKC